MKLKKIISVSMFVITLAASAIYINNYRISLNESALANKNYCEYSKTQLAEVKKIFSLRESCYQKLVNTNEQGRIYAQSVDINIDKTMFINMLNEEFLQQKSNAQISRKYKDILQKLKRLDTIDSYHAKANIISKEFDSLSNEIDKKFKDLDLKSEQVDLFEKENSINWEPLMLIFIINGIVVLMTEEKTKKAQDQSPDN